MKIEAHIESDPKSFADKVMPYLFHHEAINNLILGICASLKNHSLQAELMLYLTKGEEIVGVALQSKKRGLVYSPMEIEVLEVLASTVTLSHIPTLVGEKKTTETLAPLLEKRFGIEFEVAMNQGVYELKKVIPAKATQGVLRRAGDSDYDLVLSYTDAFVAECMPKEYDKEQIIEMVTRRLKTQDFFLWEVNGESVSIAALGGATESGIRVGVVYTPKEKRGRGLASITVANVSQWALDQGYKSVFLYTDLLNPTSNSIYQKIGYKRVGDALMYQLKRELK